MFYGCMFKPLYLMMQDKCDLKKKKKNYYPSSFPYHHQSHTGIAVPVCYSLSCAFDNMNLFHDPHFDVEISVYFYYFCCAAVSSCPFMYQSG